MDNSKKQPSQLSFEKVSVIYNADVADSYCYAKQVVETFNNAGFNACVCESDKFDSEASFVVTIGGDGTLLKAAGYYASLNVPVFGINLGRLGFLAQANPEEIEFAVEKLVNGEFNIQSRMMIESDAGAVALNDIVIKGDSFSRTSKFFLSVNDKIVCDYLADGIIISTPTGSTAYTLSAGGPVLAPEIEAMVVVPICPHTLTARPLVVPADDVIKVTGCESTNAFKVSADGQISSVLNADGTISIRKSDTTAKLVILEKDENEFYSVLRKKLQWGVAPVK